MGHRFWGRIRAFILLIAGFCATFITTTSLALAEDDLLPLGAQADGYLLPQSANSEPLDRAAQYFQQSISRSAEGDLFLLDIHADGYLLAESVLAYKSDEHYLIDFPAFLEAVEFPITYEDNVWSGWFRSDDTEFSWNTVDEIADITGRDGVQIDILQWVEDAEGFFVSTDMLGVWFDMQLTVDPRLQTVEIASEELLPFQEWQERTLAKYRYRSAQSLDADIIVPDQYHWATMPLFNLSTQLDLRQRDGTTGHASTSSMVAGMDLAKHSVMYTGTLVRSKHEDESDGHSTHRLTIERAAATPEGTLFAGANRYMLGDIYQGTTNLVVNANTGRGFSIGRYSEGNSGNLSRVTIVGDAPPGWEVELYRNDILLEFSSVGADGRYVFADQQVPFGENIFVAKLFGPLGQTREDRQTFWGGGTELERGDYDYSVSHIDFDQYFIDGVHDYADTLPASYSTDFRATRAWTENFQIGAAYTRAGLGTRDRDGTYTDSDYVSLLGRAKLGPGVFIGEAAKQLDEGVAWSIEYLTGLNGHNVSFAHRVFSDFESPVTVHQQDLDSVNEISFSGPFGQKSANGYTVQLRRRDKADGTSDLRVFNRIGTRIGPVSLSNDLDHITAAGPATTNGHLKVAGRVSRVSLRGQLDYQLSGEQVLTQVSATMNWDYTRRLNNNLILTQSLANDKRFFFTNLLSLGVRNYALTFSVSSNLDDAWQVGAGLNIAFGYDKRRQRFISNERGLAGTGRAAMNLFIDENNNGVREPDEPPVPWASYQGEETLSKSPGTVSLNAVPRYRPLKIDTSRFKFDDPFLVPRAQIYELYTHAGSDVSVDIAIVMTGDIEGYIYNGSGEDAVPVKGVVVTLYDANGREISAARSEFDGFYSFTAIPAGDYEVRVTPNAGENLATQTFSLDGEEGFVVLDEIVLYE